MGGKSLRGAATSVFGAAVKGALVREPPGRKVERGLSDRIVDSFAPSYNFTLSREVYRPDFEAPLHNHSASTEKPQVPSNHFWEAANFKAYQTWMSGRFSFFGFSAGVTTEIFVGTPVAKDGKRVRAIYVVMRHWKGHSRANVLTVGQYLGARGMVTDQLELLPSKFANKFANTIKGLTKFLLGLLDYGTQQADLVGQPLPNRYTHAIAVLAKGHGWAAEGGASSNAAIPTELWIEYIDLVVSYELLVYYESVYQWQVLESSFYPSSSRAETRKRLEEHFRDRPTWSNGTHPGMKDWYDFCRINEHPPWERVQDPRAGKFRTGIEHDTKTGVLDKMHRLYREAAHWMPK